MNKEMIPIQLTHDEVNILYASLNEVLHGIDTFEFETRLGYPMDAVRELFGKLNNILSA